MRILRKIAAAYFLSGATNLTTENRRRIVLLNGILLAGFLALVPAGLSALLLRQNYPLAIFDGSFAVVVVVFIIWLRLSLNVRLVGTAATLAILGLFSFLLISGGDKNTGPLWLYLYPLISFFLVGGRTAISLNAGFIITTATLLFLPDLLQTSYDPAFRGRFLGSLLTLTGITYVFEYSRKDAQDKMLIAQKETDDIFHAIREGLFLLTRRGNEYLIGSKYSGIVTKMLRTSELTDRPLIPLLKAHYPDLDTAGIARYLALLFNHTLDEAMLTELNPLKQLDGNRILAFTFYRVIQGAGTGKTVVESVMCTIEDRTEEVKLQKELAARRERDDKQTSLLLQMLHTNPNLLAGFIETAGGYEKEINAALSDAKAIDAELIDNTFRKVHTIKGDARALGLESVGDHAHAVEEKIAALRQMPQVTGADLLPLVVELGNLRQVFEHLDELTALLRSHRGETATTQTPLKDTLYHLVRQLKQTIGKDVRLVTDRFDEGRIPPGMLRPIQEILIQMIRNSFVHGLETAEERRTAGKAAQGSITVELDAKSGQWEIRYTDDGRGLDTRKLAESAVRQGIASAAEIKSWEKRQVYGLIFRKGLSTAGNIDNDAGRGIGMDIIQENVKQSGGRIRLRSKKGSGIEFIFEFAGS